MLAPEMPNQKKTNRRWPWISDCCVTSSQLRKNCIWPVQPSGWARSEEHTSELQSLMRISYAVFCLKKQKNKYHPLIPLIHKNHRWITHHTNNSLIQATNIDK